MNEVLEAVRAALASYLVAELAAEFPTLIVHPEWPAPGQDLGEFALTVLATGDLEHVFYPPTVIRTKPVAGGPLGDVTYSYGRIDGLQLELDAWATASYKRDRLARAMEALLHRPPTATMVGATRERKLSRAGGIVLAVPGLLATPCHFAFASTPSVGESAEAVATNEWRAHWRGTAELSLVTQEAATLVQRLFIQLGVDGVSELVRA